MTEKQQAMADALSAIIKARSAAKQGGSGGMTPPGDIDMPVDPNLLTPKDKPQSSADVHIDDPDNILGQQKQNQKNQQQNSKSSQGQQAGQQQAGEEQQPSGKQSSQQSGQEQSGEGQSGQQGGQEQHGGQPGGSQEQHGGSNEQQNIDTETNNKGDANTQQTGGQSGATNEPNKNTDSHSQQTNDDSDDSEESEPEELAHHAFSDEFTAAWNEIIDRFDNESVSDADLQLLIQKIQLGTVKNI